MTIILFGNLPWSWPADYVRQTAIQLSKSQDVCCFLAAEPITLWGLCSGRDVIWEKKASRLWTYRPFSLPFGRFSMVRDAQKKMNMALFRLFVALNLKSRGPTIFWMFDPMAVEYLHLLPSLWKTLYDCVDYIQDAREGKLISSATWMVVNSHALFSIHRKKRKDIGIVPQGFREDAARSVFVRSRAPAPRTIGFVGVLDYRINYELIDTLAKRNPSWLFVLQGKICEDPKGIYQVAAWVKRLKNNPNVIIRPMVSSKEVFTVIRAFTVGMIPYRTDIDSVVYSYPMKIFEYFYVGIPVIATPIKELFRFEKFVKIGKTVYQWERLIQTLAVRPWPKTHREEQRSLARQNSWQKKITAIYRYIGLDQR